MKLMSARARRAPAPLSTENRAPAICVAALEVDDARAPGPRSQCALGSKSNARGSPWRRTSRLSSALFPTGTVGCGRLGSVSSACLALMLDRVELDAELLDLLRARAVRLLDRRRVVTLPLGARDFVAGRVLLPLQRLELRDDPTARRSRASRSPRAPCRDRARGCAGRRARLRCDHGRTSGSSMRASDSTIR